MMEKKTIARIQSKGYDALVNAPGPEGAVRFIGSFGPGSGDYCTKTEEIPEGKDGKADSKRDP